MQAGCIVITKMEQRCLLVIAFARRSRSYKKLVERMYFDPPDFDEMHRQEPFRRILGLRWTATTAQLKAAYRKRVLETHPDHGGTAAEFRKVKRAYDTLRKGLSTKVSR